MRAFLLGALTGAAFGVVLYKVGATRYSRVMGMLTLRDTKIMKFAFTAIGVASLLYGLAAAAGVAETWGVVPARDALRGAAHLLGRRALRHRARGLRRSAPAPAWPRPAAAAARRSSSARRPSPASSSGVLLYACSRTARCGPR